MAHSLFSVHGVEIEYAVVSRTDGRVLPRVADLLTDLDGSPDAHPTFGLVELDNELAAHVLEIKASHPVPKLLSLLPDFEAALRGVNAALAKWDAKLLGCGMHPFMDPARESRLWDYEDNAVYEAFDRIFNCKGHGWLNVQSTHLNLPFDGDAEFSRLHNGISLLLPLLPALAANSPIWDGKPGSWLDGRLSHYANNQKQIPEIIGPLVPEPVANEQEYRDKILAPMYKAVAPFDPEGILQDEWLNSRAAIARFDRSAIEIRCLDTQAEPKMDLALCHFATCCLKMMVEREKDLYGVHKKVPVGLLRELFLETARVGRSAKVPEAYPARLLNPDFRGGCVGDLLQGALPSVYRHADPNEESAFRPMVEKILREGNFAERILRRWEDDPDPARLCAWLEGLVAA